MKKIALYPGSFDPITYGHLDIIQRALKVFDNLIIAVASNSKKTALFTPEERVELIRLALKDFPEVTVDWFEGLTVEYAEKMGVNAIIRGLRAVSDFEYEFQMAHMNKRLKPDIETFFLPTGESLFYLSSQIVKEVVLLGGDVSGMVPDVVAKWLKEKIVTRSSQIKIREGD